MKKLIAIAFCASLICLAGSGLAQTKKDNIKIGEGIDRTAKKAAHATASTAKKVGNGTASTASKLASKVTDKVYKDKVGPEGQKIYIDSHARYYYVDSKGRKVYMREAELKDK
ncbi:MAG TPA: hypothetical protein DIT07_07705 [Sphingobacteriaceae bacterium]|nr:hypothetical protein [Sphingobacteriaceae bacterium]